MDSPRFIDQALEWFKKQEVDTTVVDLMYELEWPLHRARGVLRILERKGLIKKVSQGDHNNPTLWAVA
jgi:hypothetical protein